MCQDLQAKHCKRVEVRKEGEMSLVSCELCTPLQRYCTFTQAHDKEEIYRRFPNLIFPTMQLYAARQIAAPPVNIDVANMDEDQVEEAEAEEAAQVKAGVTVTSKLSERHT